MREREREKERQRERYGGRENERERKRERSEIGICMNKENLYEVLRLCVADVAHLSLLYAFND
jgi:hypothetical protein